MKSWRSFPHTSSHSQKEFIYVRLSQTVRPGRYLFSIRDRSHLLGSVADREEVSPRISFSQPLTYKIFSPGKKHPATSVFTHPHPQPQPPRPSTRARRICFRNGCDTQPEEKALLCEGIGNRRSLGAVLSRLSTATLPTKCKRSEQSSAFSSGVPFAPTPQKPNFSQSHHNISAVSIAVAIISSIFSASFCSELRMILIFGFVTGCFATKIVQQSSYG